MYPSQLRSVANRPKSLTAFVTTQMESIFRATMTAARCKTRGIILLNLYVAQTEIQKEGQKILSHKTLSREIAIKLLRGHARQESSGKCAWGRGCVRAYMCVCIVYVSSRNDRMTSLLPKTACDSLVPITMSISSAQPNMLPQLLMINRKTTPSNQKPTPSFLRTENTTHKMYSATCI